MNTTQTGAQLIARQLAAAGVKRVFGVPGVWVLPLWEALPAAGITLTLARSEEGAAYAADGYARASGEFGVIVVNSGPGATNTLTGLAVSLSDSVPLLVITPDRAAPDRRGAGRGASHTPDVRGMFELTTKAAAQANAGEQLPPLVAEAISHALGGRPGPVHVSIPYGMLTAAVQVAGDMTHPIPALPTTSWPRPTHAEVQTAARKLAGARKPLILVGAGLGSRAAARRLLAVAEAADVPVAGTIATKRWLDEHHPLVLGPIGRFGRTAANQAVYGEADRVLVLGAGRAFDDAGDRLMARSSGSAQGSLEIDDERRVDVGAQPDAFMAALAEFASGIAGHGADRAAALRRSYPDDDLAGWTPRAGVLHPQQVCEALDRQLDAEMTITADLPTNSYWIERYVSTWGEDRFVMNTGFGTMGHAIAAAVGVCLARPGEHVIATIGDGGLLMLPQELSTAVAESAPITIVVFNNSTLGAPRAMSSRMAHRRVAVDLPSTDFVALARAFGADGWRVTNPRELDKALDRALATGAPTVVEAITDPDVMPAPFTGPQAMRG